MAESHTTADGASAGGGVGQGGEEVPRPVADDADQDAPPTPPRPTAANHASWASNLQSFTDRALHFLSHASNETLGACLVGLGAGTYVILGRLGLFIIGVAGGVVLHATWEGVRHDDRDESTKTAERERRREAGVEVAKRVLNWREAGVGGDRALPTDDAKVFAGHPHPLDFSSFGPSTAAALTTFTNAVIKDYVHYWYDPTIPNEPTFPAACRQTLTAFILSLSNHLSRKRPADAFLDFTTNASSIILVLLSELSAALSASPNAPPEEAISTYLSLKPDSSLAYMLDRRHQDAKLADAAEDLLASYLDPKAFNFPPARVFLKEVLARLVLGYTVEYCARPEFLNEWIVYGLEESERVGEVMGIVDAGVEGRQPAEVQASEKAPVEEKAGEPDTKEPSPLDGMQSGPEVLPERPGHERQMSKAEDAMDEAMREAKRLTQMMIEEDERRAKEEAERQGMAAAASSSEDVSEQNTQGAVTPTSSHSDRERQSEEVTAWDAGDVASSRMASPTKAEQHAKETQHQQFTSFDQLAPSHQPTALSDGATSEQPASRQDPPPPPPPPQLTLHNARISIFDDSAPNERTNIKAKPQTDYLIQIEPASSAFPGWMIARKYPDFETLHEVLRRISAVAGVPQFVQTHPELPPWRGRTKNELRRELEGYLGAAVRWRPLAESEGMKRFLERDQGLMKGPGGGGAKGLSWPTPDAFGKFGNDMMGVLTKAPKQVGAGGKAVFGGLAGVVGGAAGKQRSGVGSVGGQSPNPSRPSLSRASTSTAPDVTPTLSGVGSAGHIQGKASESQAIATDMYPGSMTPAARLSQESLSSLPPRPSARERKASVATTASTSESTADLRPRPSLSSSRLSREMERPVKSPPQVGTAHAESTESGNGREAEQMIAGLDGSLEPATVNLPPPPSEIEDDFGTPGRASTSASERVRRSTETPPATPPRPAPQQQQTQTQHPTKPDSARPAKAPLTERETSVAVELLFAVITELYTLSSAWNIRRTLLAAAKNFLLRPGNPQLTAIQTMLQTSLLDHNLSDAGLAAHLLKLRENALPTAEEMEVWRREYPEKTAEEKEALRVRARGLLVRKGMPAALTSVMGAAASGEALGRVFDCLQVEGVGRGVVAGLVLQGVRGVMN